MSKKDLVAMLATARAERQKGFICASILAAARIVQIGVGRGITWTEILAGTGLGELTLIDPQQVAFENVGLSGYRLDEVGLPKVEAAARRVRAINPAIKVTTHKARANEVPGLGSAFAIADLVKIGIDDPVAQFELADLAQTLGTAAIIGGTTGDSRQCFIALVRPGGPPLRDLLPHAWAGLQTPRPRPPFYRSTRIYAERVNLMAADAALGLLHAAGDAASPFTELGLRLLEQPLIVGLNGIHGDEYAPARLLERSV